MSEEHKGTTVKPASMSGMMLVLLVGFMLGVVATIILVVPRAGKTDDKPEQAVTGKTAIEQDVATLMKLKTDLDKVVPYMGQRLDQLTENHNKMAQDVRVMLMQHMLENRIMAKALADRFGKDKWEKSMADAEKAVREELAAQAPKPQSPAPQPAAPAPVPAQLKK